MSNVTTFEWVTEQICSALEQAKLTGDVNKIPWLKKWNGSGPLNKDGNPYTGINRWLLSRDGNYFTFNEIKRQGGKINAGAKAERVVFFSLVEKKTEETDENGVVVNGKVKYPLWRVYNVFHISDTTGMKAAGSDEAVIYDTKPIEEIESCVQSYIKKYGIKFVKAAGLRPIYSVSRDTIEMPAMGQYQKCEHFYNDLFHEAIHSTGNKARLDRKLECATDRTRAKEELVAEIGSAMLCGEFQIDTMEVFSNSVAYIDSWLSKIRGDKSKRLIIDAASAAGKAAEMVMGR